MHVSDLRRIQPTLDLKISSTIVSSVDVSITALLQFPITNLQLLAVFPSGSTRTRTPIHPIARLPILDLKDTRLYGYPASSGPLETGLGRPMDTFCSIGTIAVWRLGERLGNAGSDGTRGVQYVHLVMHKCITVKVGGKLQAKHVKR